MRLFFCYEPESRENFKTNRNKLTRYIILSRYSFSSFRLLFLLLILSYATYRWKQDFLLEGIESTHRRIRICIVILLVQFLESAATLDRIHSSDTPELAAPNDQLIEMIKIAFCSWFLRTPPLTLPVAKKKKKEKFNEIHQVRAENFHVH